MDAFMDGWIHGWMDGWTDERGRWVDGGVGRGNKRSGVAVTWERSIDGKAN